MIPWWRISSLLHRMYGLKARSMAPFTYSRFISRLCEIKNFPLFFFFFLAKNIAISTVPFSYVCTQHQELSLASFMQQSYPFWNSGFNVKTGEEGDWSWVVNFIWFCFHFCLNLVLVFVWYSFVLIPNLNFYI